MPLVRRGRFPQVLRAVLEDAATLEHPIGYESSKLPSQSSVRLHQNDPAQENDKKKQDRVRGELLLRYETSARINHRCADHGRQKGGYAAPKTPIQSDSGGILWEYRANAEFATSVNVGSAP